MDIRELYSSRNGVFVIAGSCEKDAAVWDMRNYTKVLDLKTKFEPGGKRLAITDSVKYCASAAYVRSGITLYDAQTGMKIWNTKAVKHIQKIKFTKKDAALAVSNDSDWTYILSLADGKIIEKLPGTERLFNPYYNDIIVEDDFIAYEQCRGIKLEEGKFILSCCCMRNGLSFSTVGGGLFVYDKDSKMLWQTANKENEHFVKLSYLKKYNYLCGIIYKYNEPRTRPYYAVYCYNADSGKLVYTHDLDNGYTYTFIKHSEEIFSGSGSIFQLNKDGVGVIKKLEV